MELNDLEELRDYSELDLLYKLIDIAKDNIKRTEQFIKGNKTAGVDVRHSMQDVRLLAEIIRESIQIKKGAKNPGYLKYKDESIIDNKIERAIINKKESIEKENALIKKREIIRIKKKK